MVYHLFPVVAIYGYNRELAFEKSSHSCALIYIINNCDISKVRKGSKKQVATYTNCTYLQCILLEGINIIHIRTVQLQGSIVSAHEL